MSESWIALRTSEKVFFHMALSDGWMMSAFSGFADIPTASRSKTQKPSEISTFFASRYRSMCGVRSAQ